MTSKHEEMKQIDPPVLKEDINLRVNPKAGHYKPEDIKTEKTKMIIPEGDPEKLYLEHL
jgi:hypothetical protein